MWQWLNGDGLRAKRIARCCVLPFRLSNVEVENIGKPILNEIHQSCVVTSLLWLVKWRSNISSASVRAHRSNKQEKKSWSSSFSWARSPLYASERLLQISLSLYLAIVLIQCRSIRSHSFAINGYAYLLDISFVESIFLFDSRCK